LYRFPGIKISLSGAFGMGIRINKYTDTILGIRIRRIFPSDEILGEILLRWELK